MLTKAAALLAEMNDSGNNSGSHDRLLSNQFCFLAFLLNRAASRGVDLPVYIYIYVCVCFLFLLSCSLLHMLVVTRAHSSTLPHLFPDLNE